MDNKNLIVSLMEILGKELGIENILTIKFSILCRTKGYYDYKSHRIVIKYRKLEMMIPTALHEMRHVWQRINHPEWFKYYISPGVLNKSYYRDQEAEVDAQAFAYIYTKMLCGNVEERLSPKEKNRIKEIEVEEKECLENIDNAIIKENLRMKIRQQLSSN